MLYDDSLDFVGNTPLVKLECSSDFVGINLFAKLEMNNPTGSVKDRAASYIIPKLLENRDITKDYTIVESSSGNFGVALSAYCRKYSLKFICVVDPHISPVNKMLIKSFNAEIIQVNEHDENGGYLLTRINEIERLKKAIDNVYWVNQYANPLIRDAYYYSLGNELCHELEDIDYVFAGISSGGTLAGISRRIKEVYTNASVIAVDVVGSVIFGGKPQKRSIPGIGSSLVPKNLKYAQIDDVVYIDELETIRNCHKLLSDFHIFAGGSSGSVYAGVKKYFKDKKNAAPINVVMIFPDKGDRYVNTIYSEKCVF